MGPGFRRDDTVVERRVSEASAAYSRSTIVTLAMPPPSHMVWSP
jgi:hypothetical protein